MENINDKFLAQMMLGSAILRFPMHKNGTRIIGGAVLVFDSIQKLHNVLKILEEMGIACRCDNLTDDENKPRNYQIGIHIYRKGEKEDALLKYLENENFFPVIFVNGIVPDFFEGYGYIFRQSDVFSTEVKLLCERFKEWVINHIEIVMEEIRRAKTSGKVADGVNEFYELYLFGLAISQVWKAFYLSDGVTEDMANTWQNQFLAWLIKTLRDRDRFTGFYQITEAVKYFLYQYFDEHECYVKELMDYDEEIHELVNQDKVLLYDHECYRIKDSFLEKICKPLLSAVTYTHLKQELVEEGTILCNDTAKKNFTTKKLFTIGENNLVVRPRFIKIRKEALLSDEGLTLEKYQEINGGVGRE